MAFTRFSSCTRGMHTTVVSHVVRFAALSFSLLAPRCGVQFGIASDVIPTCLQSGKREYNVFIYLNTAQTEGEYEDV